MDITYKITKKGEKEYNKFKKNPDKTELTEQEQSFIIELKDNLSGKAQLQYVNRTVVVPEMSPYTDEARLAVAKIAKDLYGKGMIEKVGS